MNKTDRKFLSDLAQEMLYQDNRCTANPLFVVQQRECFYGVDLDHTDDFVFIRLDDPESTWKTYDEAVEALREDGIDVTEDNFDEYVGKVGIKYYWSFVNAHFTERAAKRYIANNHHNLKTTRIYVTSQYRCEEFNCVVNILKTFVGHSVFRWLLRILWR